MSEQVLRHHLHAGIKVMADPVALNVRSHLCKVFKTMNRRLSPRGSYGRRRIKGAKGWRGIRRLKCRNCLGYSRTRTRPQYGVPYAPLELGVVISGASIPSELLCCGWDSKEVASFAGLGLVGISPPPPPSFIGI